VQEICLLRSRWRGLETESRWGLRGHERGNPGYGQGHYLTDHRASPRPYHTPSNSPARREVQLMVIPPAAGFREPQGCSVMWKCTTLRRS